MLFSLAELNEHELDIIQKLEKKIGTRILALRPMKIEFDSLTEDEVAEINQLEVELGIGNSSREVAKSHIDEEYR